MRVGRHEAAGDRGASSVHRAGLDCGSGAGHEEERTKNIHHIVVTLEVSKLSGWLNADAPCRYIQTGACGAGRGVPAGRRGGTRSVWGRARLQIGDRATGTLNMKLVL